MSRLTRFEEHAWIGDKRSQVVHNQDVCSEPSVLEALTEAETFICFGPDTLAEARNRGYRRCDTCEGIRSAEVE